MFIVFNTVVCVRLMQIVVRSVSLRKVHLQLKFLDFFVINSTLEFLKKK